MVHSEENARIAKMKFFPISNVKNEMFKVYGFWLVERTFNRKRGTSLYMNLAYNVEAWAKFIVEENDRI